MRARLCSNRMAGPVIVWKRLHQSWKQERDAASALLVEGNLKGLGDGVLARAVKTGQEDDEALLGTGRVALAEGLHNSAIEVRLDTRFPWHHVGQGITYS